MPFGKKKRIKFNIFITSLYYNVHNDFLLSNSISIMGSTIITSVIGYFYWIVATHIYSAHDIGLASALIAVVTLISTLANLGIGSTLIQMLPRCETEYTWSLTLNTGLTMGTLLGLLASTLAIVALPLFSNQFHLVWSNIFYIFVFVISVPLWIVTTLLDQVLVAERAAINMLMRNTAFAILKLLLMLLLIQTGALGIFSSWTIATAVTLLGGLLLIPHLRRAYYLTFHGMVGQVRTMLSSLAGHHFINIGGMIPMFLLPVFVTVRLSATDNAYFYTTSTVSNLFFMISSAIATALFAEGSYTSNDVLHTVRTAITIIIILLIPTMLACFLSGKYILLLFGQNYAHHGFLLLMIFTIAAIPDAITNIYVSMLRVQMRLRSAALLNIGIAVLILALAWILLPLQGIVGAGWAFLFAESIGSLVVGVDVLLIRRLQHSTSRSIL